MSDGTIAAGIVEVEVGPIVHDVDARWLMAYAAGLGEHDPRFFDTLAATGPLAHPLFSVCYEWPTAVALRDRTIDRALQPRGVHATHHLVIHRPPHAGDRLRTRGRVIAVEPRRSGTLVVSRFETTDADGRPVTTTDYGSVYRGVSLVGEPRTTVAPEPAVVSRRVGPEGRGSRPGPADWTALVAVRPRLAWVYTECARIWNPIHTDVAVARGAGLAAPILHGTATLGLAVSHVMANAPTADPALVGEVSARFTGMVGMPSTLTVRGRDLEDHAVGFEVLNESATPVVADGRLRFRVPLG